MKKRIWVIYNPLAHEIWTGKAWREASSPGDAMIYESREEANTQLKEASKERPLL